MANNDSNALQPIHQPKDPQPASTTVSNLHSVALPAEIIYHICRFLDPYDLIRLQLVSKPFHAIVHDPAVWRTAYTVARLPLPPGPFPWQSLRYLQRTLLRSARLAQGWTTDPLTLLSREVFAGPRTIETDRSKWVRGRWLIVSKNMERLVSRDIDTGLEQVLWNHGVFGFWAAGSVTSSLGHLLYLAVHVAKGRLSDPVKLLKFVINDDTGYMSGPEMFDVPTWSLPREAFVPRIRVSTGLAPYVYISICPASRSRQSLVFDPRRRRFYKFPRFRTQLELLLNYPGGWLPHLVEVYVLETCLFVLNRSYLIHGYIGNVEVIQIFSFPEDNADADPDTNPNSSSDPNRDTVRELRLTHEFFSRDTGSLWLAPICNPIVEPTTHTTMLRFLHTYAPFQPSRDSRVRLVCRDYFLPATHPCGDIAAQQAQEDARARNHNRNFRDGVENTLGTIVRSVDPILPIIIVSHDVFSVLGAWNGNLIDASSAGFVRGLCMVRLYPEESEIPDLARVHKFSLDASSTRCVAVVGDASPPWEGLKTSRHYVYSFDGMRGRVWETQWDALEMDSAGKPVDRDTLAIVADFK